MPQAPAVPPSRFVHRPTDKQGNFKVHLAPAPNFIDPNETVTTLPKGQTFTIHSNEIAQKIVVDYKTTQRVNAR